MAKYYNTNRTYGLTIKDDLMSPQMDYILLSLATF